VRRLVERPPRRVRRFVEVGALPGDSPEVRARKAGLVLSSALMAALSCVWVVTYAVLGLWVSALIPFAYQVATAVSIAVFARTHRYAMFRRSQLVLPLLLPFALQLSLGGFENSSAVCLWAITAPMGALVFVGARQAVPWFGAFAILVAVAAAIDPVLAEEAPDIPEGVRVAFFALNVLGVATTVFAVLEYFVREREREQARSERLLLNVLPAPIAVRLKEQERVIADDLPEATVLFADLVGFTTLAERLPASEVVALLDAVFARWDALAAAHGAEKIKTIGDAYMVAAGVPLPQAGHAEAIAELALAMGPELAACATSAGVTLELRIGIDSGPVVAGVIGRSKFSYDLWGDTVNTASRMESHAEPGTIQVTERTAERLRGRFELRERGTVEVKGKGPMRTHQLLGPRASGVTP
jgi:class 3 adenylate cyclase